MKEHKVIQIEQSELDNFLEKTSEKLVLANFRSREVTSSVVCEILGVTAQTIHNYVKSSKLIPVNPGSGKHYFRLSDVLGVYMRKTNKN